MNKGQKVLAGMLAVVVVVLAMVAFAPRPEEPTVIAASVVVKGTDSTYHAYRFWSDGAIDVTYAHFENNFSHECEVVTQCGPVVVIP